MIKQSNLVFKDLKNLRRSTALLSRSASKDITLSAKDIKNVRSTKQIDITNFMENRHDKIKNIDEKLEVHQTEINRNNQIIEELSNNFIALKEQLEKEREHSLNEERKNKLLREEIERTNKILRNKNSKIQELLKKSSDLQKDNDSLKVTASKCEEYSKTINTLRSRVAQAEDNIAELKGTLSQKEKEGQKQREKLNTLDVIKAKEEELNGQVLMKDVLIGNLRQAINELQQEKSKEAYERNGYERKIDRLTSEIQILKTSQKSLNATIASLEKKCQQSKTQFEELQSEMKSGDSKLRDKEKEENLIKKECSDLKEKVSQISSKHEQTLKELSKKDSKIEKLTQKIRDLENNLGESYKQKEKLRDLQEKMAGLKKKGENLQSVYYSIVPQIQCPFGHQLQNPVTIIPCGHNYCLGCKKGYLKECMQCCGKLKIEAVYRNELMDDIIGMVTGIKQVMELLK